VHIKLEDTFPIPIHAAPSFTFLCLYFLVLRERGLDINMGSKKSFCSSQLNLSFSSKPKNYNSQYHLEDCLLLKKKREKKDAFSFIYYLHFK